MRERQKSVCLMRRNGKPFRYKAKRRGRTKGSVPVHKTSAGFHRAHLCQAKGIMIRGKAIESNLCFNPDLPERHPFLIFTGNPGIPSQRHRPGLARSTASVTTLPGASIFASVTISLVTHEGRGDLVEQSDAAS
jgi:hypothetical protein